MHIIFVHGLRQNSKDWRLFSPLIASALGCDFSEVDYGAKIWTRSNPEAAADRLETEISRDAESSQEIFIVAYSLGGLITRLFLERVYTAKSSRNDLLGKIAGVVTLATPLHGPRSRWMRKSPFGLIPWVDFIGRQAGKHRIDFASAIASASQNDFKRPRFHHIQFEEDFWSAPHTRSLYTEDDVFAGTLVGGHSGIVGDARARDISAHVVAEIRKTRTTQVPVAVEPTKEVHDTQITSVILISCSATKSTKNERPFSPPCPGDWLADRNLVDDLLAKRLSILSKMKNSILEDRTYGQGNRGEKALNKAIVHGPDFGMDANVGRLYLPGYERYIGRLFGQLATIDWEEFHSRRRRPLILIMSGLYGFVQSNEMIQNYDVHLSDREQTTNTPVKDLWTSWFTDSINNLTRSIGGKVKVYNLLADEDYTGAISWPKLDRRYCSVYHLKVFDARKQEERFDKELLTPAGAVLSGMITQNDLDTRIDRSAMAASSVYQLSDVSDNLGDLSQCLFTFERAIGETEGQIDWSSPRAIR